MKRKLHDHQLSALQYTLGQKHPALFMEMRLGKTLVTLRRCLLYKPLSPDHGLRILVVAPNSALGSWRKECEAENIVLTELTGTKKKRKTALLCSFMVRDAKPRACLINKEGWIALPEIANPKICNWDAVILDESSFIKEPKPQVTKFFLKHFRDVPHRWCLTGTPNPEGMENYFCQLAFLHGYAFGCKTFWQFRAKYMRPACSGFGWILEPGTASMIHKEVGQKCLVMRREDVGLKENKIYETRSYQLPQKIRDSYDTAEQEFILEYEGKESRTLWQGRVWQWLRQICGGFIDGEFVWKEKVDDLVSLLRGELKGEYVVVWCCYNNEVKAIGKALQDAGIGCRCLWGEHKPRERELVRQEFIKKKIRVIVLQQAIAQMGMDLSVADTAIYYSAPVSCLARTQTEDRILTIEKAKEGRPLLYIDMVVEDSVDADVNMMMDGKKSMSTSSMNRALRVAMKERIGWTKNLKRRKKK